MSDIDTATARKIAEEWRPGNINVPHGVLQVGSYKLQKKNGMQLTVSDANDLYELASQKDYDGMIPLICERFWLVGN